MVVYVTRNVTGHIVDWSGIGKEMIDWMSQYYKFEFAIK